jgi:hypothetical protein
MPVAADKTDVDLILTLRFDGIIYRKSCMEAGTRQLAHEITARLMVAYSVSSISLDLNNP